MKIIELETPRLLLRMWQEKDKLPFTLMNSHPEVMRYFPSVLSEQQSTEMLSAQSSISFPNKAAGGYGLLN